MIVKAIFFVLLGVTFVLSGPVQDILQEEQHEGSIGNAVTTEVPHQLSRFEKLKKQAIEKLKETIKTVQQKWEDVKNAPGEAYNEIKQLVKGVNNTIHLGEILEEMNKRVAAG